MRITNKIMQRNNLSNINTNKVLEDKLTSQLSSEKKIIRPSDDPVICKFLFCHQRIQFLLDDFRDLGDFLSSGNGQELLPEIRG